MTPLHDLPEFEYRAPQVCNLTGITYRQLDYWARTGLVKPSISRAFGSGTHRLYSFEDLVELTLTKTLLEDGRTLRAVRDALRSYRIGRRRHGELGLFLIQSEGSWRCVGDLELAEVTITTIVSIDWLRVRIEEQLAALPSPTTVAVG